MMEDGDNVESALVTEMTDLSLSVAVQPRIDASKAVTRSSIVVHH
jgi:hypothetical protein